jgi:histone H1/5
MKKFQKAMQDEIEQVVLQLASHFKFDAEEAVKFIKTGTKTRKVVEKRSKLSPEAKVARELAKAAIAKAKQNDRDAKKAAKVKVKEDAKAAKLAEKEAAKAAKLAEKEAAKAAKLAEREAAAAAKKALRDEARAIKLAEKEAIKLAKLADKAAAKALVDAEKAAAKAIVDAEKAAAKAIVDAAKAGAKAAKDAAKAEAKVAKLAVKALAKREKLIAEIHNLAQNVGGGVKFGENEVENADMAGLKEIRKTLKKCISKLERADQKACAESQRRVDNAKFAGQMGLPIC